MRGPLSRRAATVVVAVLVLVASLTSATGARAQTKIMVVGDSISQGFEGDYTWRYRLKQHLTAAGVNSDFVGPWTGTNALPDAIVDGAPPRFDGAYRASFADSQHMARWGWQLHMARWDVAPEVKSRQPALLIVALGFNDLGWGVNSPAGALADLKELIANARVAKPNVKVAIVNVAQRSALGNLPDLPAKISDYNQRLAAAMPSINQAGSPAVLVDVASVMNATQPHLRRAAPERPRRVRDRQAGRRPARVRARDRPRVRRHPGVDPRRADADDPVAGHGDARRHGAEGVLAARLRRDRLHALSA